MRANRTLVAASRTVPPTLATLTLPTLGVLSVIADLCVERRASVASTAIGFAVIGRSITIVAEAGVLGAGVGVADFARGRRLRVEHRAETSSG